MTINRIINSTRNDYYESNTNCLITRIIDSRQFRCQSIDDNALVDGAASIFLASRHFRDTFPRPFCSFAQPETFNVLVKQT